MNALAELFRFKGGVKPSSHKIESNATPIARAPLPAVLVVPLHQSIGGTPQPIVQAGDRVLKGQKIGHAEAFISAAVHAPTSGIVLAVEERVQPHVSGLSALSVVIEPDGRDEWIAHEGVDHRTLSPEEIRHRLQEAGVVGLGGAAFPSHAKLDGSANVPIEEIVINGAECEPFITCDDRLMRERAEDVLRGIGLLRDAMRPKRVLIGVEDNKPEAAAALRDAIARLGGEFASFEVIAVPTLYPAGGAKQLIRVLTGKAIAGTVKRTTDYGVQCFNVGTAYTAWRAIAHGEPVVSRIVTVTGNVERPGNWDVPIGMPIRDLLQLAGPREGTTGAVLGGPMMGFALPDDAAPLVKATNCVIAASDALFPPKPPEMPCIRCGECARVCPHELQPFEMYWWSRAQNFGKAQEYALFDCIECGCCSYVCPSRIPLVQYFRFAKSEIWQREKDKKAAEGAKARFEFRQFRDEREKQEKAERLAKAAAVQKAKAEASAGAAAEAGTTDPEAAKKALIAAAMERAKAQREAAQTAATPENNLQENRDTAAPANGAPSAAADDKAP